MGSLMQDFRFAIRMMAKSPGFAALAVIALGLGIGANTAVFSVANAFIRKPVDFPQLDRLVVLFDKQAGNASRWESVTPADYFEWKDQNQSYERMGAFDWNDINLTGAGDPEKLQGVVASEEFFEIVGVAPAVGRTFLPGECEPGHDHEAVLSYPLWQERFGGDPRISGKTTTLDGQSYTIVGVMPKAFSFPASAQIWTPLAMDSKERAQRDSHHIHPLARLRPGVAVAQAQAELETLQRRAQENYPQQEKGWDVWVMPLRTYAAGIESGQYALLLLGAVGFVMLIACANVANLLLARSTGRQRELAIRRALGAGRRRIMQQLLAESVLLGVGGAAVGLAIGAWGIAATVNYMPPEVERYISAWKSIRLDRDVFIFTMAVSALAGMLAGIAPALLSSRPDLVETLKAGGRGTSGSRSHHRLRSTFVVVEIALSLVLLVGATLMSKGVRGIFGMNFKFDPQTLLTMELTLPQSKYKDAPQQAQFYERLIERVASVPGAESVAIATGVPLGDGNVWDYFSVEGRPAQPGEQQTAERETISPSFFHAMHIPLVAGREFSDADGANTERVAIVSETLARQFWPGKSAIGQRVKIGHDDSPDPWATIVGVSSDVTYEIWEQKSLLAVYLPYRQAAYPYTYLVIRTKGPATAIFPAVRSEISSLDPEQPAFDVMTLERVISNQILGLSYVAVVLGALGLIALLLASVGVYGVMAYAVTERTHEIGVRMALGAQQRDVLRMLIRRGLALTAMGLGIGVPIAFVLAELLASLLYGVHANDLISFAAGVIVLSGVALLACLVPARKAMRVDPMVALRYE